MKPREPWVPYVAPFGVYMLFLLIQSRLPLESLTFMYPLRALTVAAVLVCFWKAYDELKWNGRPACSSVSVQWLLGILVGTVAIVIWIGIDPYYPGIGRIFGHLSNLMNWLGGDPVVPLPPPEVFDPTTIESVGLRYGFIGFRIFGAVIVVAFMEELFWRGFLIRWLIDEDFKKVPVGTYTRASFVLTVIFFGLEHDQWLAGVICGALYNWLYYRTRSIPACVIAHATSNALLAAWVLWQQDWKLW